MNAHQPDCGKHQRDIRKHDARAAEEHDPDFGKLDDADQLRLVVIVRKLARQRREEEEGENEQRLRDRAELELLRRVRIELVGHEQDDGLLEQAVVERPQELGREQREEPPRAEQMGDVLDQAVARRLVMELGRGIASFAQAAKPF